MTSKLFRMESLVWLNEHQMLFLLKHLNLVCNDINVGVFLLLSEMINKSVDDGRKSDKGEENVKIWCIIHDQSMIRVNLCANGGAASSENIFALSICMIFISAKELPCKFQIIIIQATRRATLEWVINICSFVQIVLKCCDLRATNSSNLFVLKSPVENDFDWLLFRSARKCENKNASKKQELHIKVIVYNRNKQSL